MRFFILSLIFVCSLKACNNTGIQSEDVSIFRYNESKGVTSLDPAQARTQTNIWPVSQVFNGLIQLDDELSIVPCIARHWIIDEEGRRYTFFLREDVLFHPSAMLDEQQRKVNADDFVYSFNRIIDPSIASPGSWIFEYLDSANSFQALNDTTLVIRLRKAFPPFLSMLAMPYCSVVPSEVVESPEVDFASEPIGTGPFKYKYWSRDELLVLVKNEEYFERDDKGDRLPYLDAINVSFIKDKQSEFLEFLKGNLDFLSGVHKAYKDELLTRSGKLNPKYSERFNLLTIPYLNTEYLGILMNGDGVDESPLSDVRIRKAINYGFDRKKMMKYLRNNLGYPATGGMIPSGLPGFSGSNKGYRFNPEKALQLLAEAGYPQGNGLPEISLTTTADYLDICEYIQFELSKVGIRIAINVNTGASFRNMVANANLLFFRASWIADYADAENYLALFYSGNWTPAGPNYTRFKSRKFDELYETSLGIIDADKRIDYYRSMDSIIIAAAPVVPLFYDVVVRFTSNGLKGFEPNPMNNLILKQAYFESED